MQSYPVSSAMVEAAKIREQESKGAWERHQGEQASSNLDASLTRERQALDDIQRKMNNLRSVSSCIHEWLVQEKLSSN